MQEISKSNQAAYFNFLNFLSIEAVEFALNLSAQRCDKFPTVKQIIAFSNEYRKPVPKGNLATMALPEFTEAQHAEAARQLEILLSKFDEWGNV